MSFLFPIALGGLALISVPILIHLIMRQKPKTLPFPAFRFLIQRHKTNLRKLRLRHLLLLALRVLLIAGLFLALAQPHLFSTKAPVAVVLVFDTSPRMDYRASDGTARLDVARDQALKLLDRLHADSKVLMLDNGIDPAAPEASRSRDWALSLDMARQRVRDLKVQPGSRPLQEQIVAGLGRISDLAESEPQRAWPGFVCVFSDRTEGSWRNDSSAELARAIDGVPPSSASLKAAQDDLPELINLLKDLRTRLPAIREAPDQTLLDALQRLQDALAALPSDDGPRPARKVLEAAPVLEQGRELLRLLAPPRDDKSTAEEKEYRDRLRSQTHKVLAKLRGVQCYFFDVGVEDPVDLAIVRLQTPLGGSGQPRTVFAQDEKWLLRAFVRASGKDLSAVVECKAGGETLATVSRDFPAGKETEVVFEVDGSKLRWDSNFLQFQVGLKTKDQLEFNNEQFLTVAAREPRRVLVIADDSTQPKYLLQALEALGFQASYKTPEQALKLDALPYEALYLFQAAQPDELWPMLENFVAKGGGLAVVPPRSGAERYATDAAQKLLPAVLTRPSPREDETRSLGAVWDLESDDTIFLHPMLRRFAAWRDENIDFIVLPRGAFQYWELRPAADAKVLVRYKNAKGPARPAILEKRPDAKALRFGKVILFTTPLDGATPIWTNYLESITSFYTVLIGLTTTYLAGDLEEMRLDFSTMQADEPSWPVPAKAFAGYRLTRGKTFRDLVPPKAGKLTFPDARIPGNYTIDGLGGEKGPERLGAFSVNLPASEGNLARLDANAIENVLGPGTIFAGSAEVDFEGILEGYGTEPQPLLPWLMLAILILLACENLLGNLFYRKEASPPAEQRGSV